MTPDDLEPTMPSSERPMGPQDPYSFCGCGKKNCPSIRSSADGSGSVIIDDDVADIVGFSTGRPGIVFTREQASKLLSWLRDSGY